MYLALSWLRIGSAALYLLSLVRFTTNDALQYAMILLIHDLKFSGPEGSKLFDSGLGDV